MRIITLLINNQYANQLTAPLTIFILCVYKYSTYTHCFFLYSKNNQTYWGRNYKYLVLIALGWITYTVHLLIKCKIFTATELCRLRLIQSTEQINLHSLTIITKHYCKVQVTRVYIIMFFTQFIFASGLQCNMELNLVLLLVLSFV